MKTASDIVGFLGADNVATRVGVGIEAVKAALRKGVLPALWYDELEHMAGRPLPRDVFSFKRATPQAAE